MRVTYIVYYNPTMQRVLPVINRLQARAALQFRHVCPATASRMYSTTQKHNKHCTAAEIKKMVPELWVRKMKTFFAFYDFNGDGVLTHEDHKLFASSVQTAARADQVDEERIKRCLNDLNTLWIEDLAGGQEEWTWTENMFLEVMFESVSRPGAEARYRAVADMLFDLTDIDKNGTISKEEYRALRGGDPWSMVAFSAIDADKDGFITREEYVHATMEFYFNFGDDTKPTKHLMGKLVEL